MGARDYTLVCHWGQRESCIMAVEFLTQHYVPDAIVIYQGTASAPNLRFIAQMFPKLTVWSSWQERGSLTMLVSRLRSRDCAQSRLLDSRCAAQQVADGQNRTGVCEKCVCFYARFFSGGPSVSLYLSVSAFVSVFVWWFSHTSSHPCPAGKPILFISEIRTLKTEIGDDKVCT